LITTLFKQLVHDFLSETRDSYLISPLHGASKSLFVKELFEKENQIVVLLPSAQSVLEINVELSILDLSEYLLPIIELKTETLQEKLTELSKRDKFILISTYELLTCSLPSKQVVEQNTTKITVGGSLTYGDLIEYFNLLNYNRDKFVEDPGDFSVRGAIIDFWSYSEKMPVRIEFDGDFIESIRFFDPESQRSIEKTIEVTIAGSLEQNSQQSAVGNGQSAMDSQQSAVGGRQSDIFEYLTNPVILASSYELSNLGREDSTSNSSISNKEKVDDEFNEILEELEINQPTTDNLPLTTDHHQLTISSTSARWIIEEEIGTSENKIELGFAEAPVIKSNYKILTNTLLQFEKEDYKIFIAAENDLQTNRLNELFSELSEEISSFIDEGKIKIFSLAVKDGFINKKEKVLLLTDYQMFSKPYRTKLPSHKPAKKNRNKEFASIKPGDFIVHEEFGIGRYGGLETIKIGEAEQESMKLFYSDGGVVYVNLNYLHLVKKYSSKEGITPSLSTLGSSDWSNTKKKTKKKIKEAARELIVLYAKRKAAIGFAFSDDSVWQKELEASFIYEDTPDQAKVTEEVKQDMHAVSPMDRLVCGDVGFGKTEIAVRAAFKAVQDGKQVALLVPTTILAEQHYNTFVDRLSQFPVKVAALSRFQTKAQQKEIVEQLAQAKVDIVIGTHRLLSKDIKFNDLGLLIIDEEHRFGVMVKEKLKALKVNVDTLTLTATPIPRTLNLSLLGARDLSIIATPPPNRQPIYTIVSTFDMAKVKTWILNELHRNGQVYFVHDRVQSIEKFSGYLLRYMPEIKIGIAHGQMKPAQLEEIIHGFLNRKFDVLLSTKIIESGIDIPNVNTMIINRADRFGLAELHQLRGRVGRSDRQAYAYFLVPSMEGINKKALRRLQAIEEFSDIGSGFNLAMRDLEIRGAGNLLGTEQSGFINDVGFDLFVKMINEAVEELKYEEFKEVFENLPKPQERTDPTIDAYFEIGIPTAFMPDQMDRLSFYTALFGVKSLNEIEEIKEEIIDRFGDLPILVRRLMAMALLKYFASRALFERVIIQRKNIFLILPKGAKQDYYQIRFVEMMHYILEKYKDKVKFQQQKDSMKLAIENRFESPEKTVEFLIKFSKEIAELFKNLDPQ
jgi:transcription-repair coupling factor (superfamily II helicase)